MSMRLSKLLDRETALVSTMKICRKEVFPCVFQSIGGKRKEAQRADNTQRKRRKKKTNEADSI